MTELANMNAVTNFLSGFGIKAVEESEGHTTAVIVALPSEVDSIRLVGDEDKHATVLFFGETSSLPADAKEKIIQVLTLASSMYEPFVENVISIERLGSEDPPALVAKLTGRWLAKIHSVLQIVPDLNIYMGNATQYPSYTPHVTFGYPDFKGEADIRALANPIGRVRFDRLALWWNGEKYEFPLTSPGYDVMEHSSDVDDFLAHFGVKGMKWGVRRDSTGGGGATGGKGLIGKVKTARLNSSEKKSRELAPIGEIRKATRNSDGKSVLIQKKTNGKWEETYLSKDAEAFAKSHLKGPHQMSNNELRTYLERARIMKDYDSMFGPQHTQPASTGKGGKKDKNAELSKQPTDHELAKLKALQDKLQTQVKINEARAKLQSPSTFSKAAKLTAKFIAGTTPAFKAFKQLDEQMEGVMSKALKESFENRRATSKANKASKSAFKSKKKLKKTKKQPFTNPQPFVSPPGVANPPVGGTP